jgi:hypothetical protein
LPGPLLHVGAIVTCTHAGQATPTVPNPRVTVSGMPTVTMTPPYAIAGCPFVPPAPGPCVTAKWITAATRVTSLGQPLLLMDSQAICAPTGTPVLILGTQVRVTAI